MRAAQVIGGILVALFGLWWAAIPLAFATMIDPTTPDDAWWGEYWARLVSGGGLPMIGMGLFATVVGACMMWGGPRDRVDPRERY